MRTSAIEAGEVEPLVIVGIYNTGDRRLAEYTHEYNWQMGGGEADKYGDLLTRELMPWIAERSTACGMIAKAPGWAALRSADWCHSIWGSGILTCLAGWRCCRPACGGITKASLAT